MARHLLNDLTIRAARTTDGTKRLSDGDGLYLLTFVNGGSHGWRLDYSFERKRKTLSLGTYPAISLAAARKRADEIREMVAHGRDPSAARKAAKAVVEAKNEAAARHSAGLPALGSFEAVAREWFDVKQDQWAPGYSSKVIRRLEVDVFPYIGKSPIASIKPPDLLAVLRRIEARGVVETAHRALESCSQVFRYGVATGTAESDPGRDLKDALKSPSPVHFPAITEPKRLGELMRAVKGYAGTPVVRAALQLAPMLMLRPGELRCGEWSEINLDAAEWLVPSERMKRTKEGKKNGEPHFVGLPSQAVAILRELRELTGQGQYLFRGERHHDRPMSDNTVNAAIRAMGFPDDEVTGHGFRATARTMLQERLGFDPDVIEAQLAHSVRDSLGRAYNRTEFLEPRRKMLQAWADYLDELAQPPTP